MINPSCQLCLNLGFGGLLNLLMVPNYPDQFPLPRSNSSPSYLLLIQLCDGVIVVIAVVVLVYLFGAIWCMFLNIRKE